MCIHVGLFTYFPSQSSLPAMPIACALVGGFFEEGPYRSERMKNGRDNASRPGKNRSLINEISIINIGWKR